MAKRPETRAAAVKKIPARKPARAARPAAETAKKATKASAEIPKAEAAKAKKRAPAKTAPTKIEPTKPAKSAKAAAPSTKAKAPTKPGAGAATKKAAAKAGPAKADATGKSRNVEGAKGKATVGKAKASSKPKMPRFLATELGHPVDHDGEPIGAGSRAALGDTELQRYTLQLWRQMQSRRGVNTHIPAMERAGVTIDQIWTAGVTDRLTTSSTPDEVKRYRQKLLFRANLLESILTETVDELQRLGTIDPTPPPAAGEPG